MIERISELLADKLADEKLIPQSQRDIYAYGAELFLLRIVFYSMLLAAALLTGTLAEGTVFTFSYLFLRQYSGGYHCSTPVRCMAVSLLLYFSMAAVYRAGSAAAEIILMSSAVISFAVTVIFSPSESENNPLTKEERKKYRIIASSVSGIYLLIAAISLKTGADVIFYPLTWSLAAVAALIIGNLLRSALPRLAGNLKNKFAWRKKT